MFLHTYKYGQFVYTLMSLKSDLWPLRVERLRQKVEFNDHDVDSKVFPINGDLRTSDNYYVRSTGPCDGDIMPRQSQSASASFYFKSFLDNYTISAQLLNYYNITVINS